MNTYLIEKRIKTPIHVFRVLEHDGYQLFPPGEGMTEGFVAKRQVSALDRMTAYGEFMEGLGPILDASSVLTQCAVYAPALGSHLIYRMNDNPDGVFYFYYARESQTVGMHLDIEELADLRAILGHPDWGRDRTAFRYLRQANLATSPLSRLSMLIIAGEALAGTTMVEKQCSNPNCRRPYRYSQTDKAALKRILGEHLYQEIYEALRHKLFHGGPVNERHVAEIGALVHVRLLLEHLKTKYSLQSVREIVEPPRNISYEYLARFTRMERTPSLVEVENCHEQLPFVEEPSEY